MALLLVRSCAISKMKRIKPYESRHLIHGSAGLGQCRRAPANGHTCTESLSARRHKGAGAAAIVAGGGARRPPRPPSGGTTLTAEPLLLYSHQRKGEIVGEYGQVGSPSRHTVAQWRRRRSGARAAREAAGGERSVARSVARSVEIARDCTRVGAGRRPSRAALARCGCAPSRVLSSGRN